jgi:hypothetical protein
MSESDVKQFFDRYAAASLSGEPARTAELYAPRFIAAAPSGSGVYSNDDGFLEWLRSLDEFNRKTGMRSMTVEAVDENRLSRTHALATVHWSAKFEKTGDEPVRFEITYLLERTEPGWKVLAYVSHKDQQEEMRRFGLL